MFILHTTIFLVQILVLNKVSILHTILQVQISVLNKVFSSYCTAPYFQSRSQSYTTQRIFPVQISVPNKELFILQEVVTHHNTPSADLNSQHGRGVHVTQYRPILGRKWKRHTSNTLSQNPGCAEEAYILYHTCQDLHPRRVLRHNKVQCRGSTLT